MIKKFLLTYIFTKIETLYMLRNEAIEVYVDWLHSSVDRQSCEYKKFVIKHYEIAKQFNDKRYWFYSGMKYCLNDDDLIGLSDIDYYTLYTTSLYELENGLYSSDCEKTELQYNAVMSAYHYNRLKPYKKIKIGKLWN